MLPKILHYCWFGGKPFPKLEQKCTKSWKTFFSGWEIKRWDETNSPMEIPYMKIAFQNKNFSNMSNYVRLYAVAQEGGIYLDTDVEILKCFDSFLEESCFFGFQSQSKQEMVNNAVFGAEKNHPFVLRSIQRLLNKFDGLEKANLSSPNLTTDLLLENGLNAGVDYNKSKIVIGNVSLFPARYFYPYDWNCNETDKTKYIKEDTYAIHHWAKSWLSDKPPLYQRAINKLKRLIQTNTHF